MSDPLTFQDPLAEAEVTINILVGKPDETGQRPVTIAAGLPGQMPIIVTAVLDELRDEIIRGRRERTHEYRDGQVQIEVIDERDNPETNRSPANLGNVFERLDDAFATTLFSNISSHKEDGADDGGGMGGNPCHQTDEDQTCFGKLSTTKHNFNVFNFDELTELKMKSKSKLFDF